MNKLNYILFTACVFISCQHRVKHETYREIGGIYPHLAYYNNEGECGTGAVVPWTDRLWVITYGPHLPYGSSDKLYEITPDLQQIIRDESIGGTPANRMIHKETCQLFIGPYVIDTLRNVRTIPYTQMPGRHTGNARHLFHPENKIYCATMEEGFYEVDVHSLGVNEIYTDGNLLRKNDDSGQYGPMLPGAHGKGAYSGQAVLVFSNNGESSKEARTRFDIESGALCEWDGTSWKVIRRNQFTEVTGPGGICGNADPENDPIWATGWDHKSLIIGVRHPETGWSFFRLPKASHSYDGAHGWNTEWPRIRNIGTETDPDFLMTMHGLFWRFPDTFTRDQTAGIRPRSAYLKVIGDFCRWQNRLVFGCDDSAKKEFLNKRKHKGGIEGPGQSNSNVWFTSFEKPDQLGPVTASGSVWLNESVKKNEYSDPFLFSGWPKRSVWIQNASDKDASFILEIDKQGTGIWQVLKTVFLKAQTDIRIGIPMNSLGEWIRVKCTENTIATVSFNYSVWAEREKQADSMFKGVATVADSEITGGLLYGLGNNRRKLGVAAVRYTDVHEEAAGYYELDEALNLVPGSDDSTRTFIQQKFAIPQHVVKIEASSVLIVDDKNRRWRLPLGDDRFTDLTRNARLRICREVATERDLFNCHGTFYELPAENADGFAKIRPVCSHPFMIHDYASYRGLLIMTGLNPNARAGDHIIRSEDGKAAVWAGVIDDLWQMGKPRGRGGPWKNTQVIAGNPSDPYLIGFYDQRKLELSHRSNQTVTFYIEAEPVGHGPWMLYQTVTIAQGETFKHIFPANFEARWIRFTADAPCIATAWLEYH